MAHEKWPLIKIEISRPDSRGNQKMNIYTLESYSDSKKNGGATYRQTGPITIPKPRRRSNA